MLSILPDTLYFIGRRALALATFFILIASYAAQATHLRAGEITARRISETTLTYEITITLYCDTQGGLQACNAQNTIDDFCFGDGTKANVPRIASVDIGNNTSRNVYRIIHTYGAPGAYRLTAGIPNRNEGVLNMNDSVNTPFSISTTILINASLGQNTTPVLLNPPVDFTAVVGQRYIHNPSAFDAEGDSIAFRLIVPAKSATNNACLTSDVNGYRDPTAVCPGNGEAGGPATFRLNAITGDLVWDAPVCEGQYNVAFVVEEWRRGVKIGEVIRDMQIIVRNQPNKRPEITVPNDTCVAAGTRVIKLIRARDPDNNRMTLFSEGGVYLYRDANGQPLSFIAPEFANFTTPTQPQLPGGTATGTFNWLTGCAHVRDEPYSVLFKVEDNPGSNIIPKLVDLKTFRVKVVAPKPLGLTATANPSDRSMVLNWTPYTCRNTGAEIIIYRKEGGCGDVTYDPCKPGLPVAAGYTEIGRVPVTTATFTDNNRGAGLKRNVLYSYRIIVTFPAPGRGNSYFSDEVCLSIASQMPVITNVTVDRTSTTAGEITVKWTRPLGLNQALLQGPYQYRLLRATGLNGNNFAPVTSINTTLGTQPDTVFTDRSLNTDQNAYRYRLEFFYTLNGALTRLDSTEAASSVRLAGTPAIRAVDLSWQANVPWNNENQRHRVYRENRSTPGTYNLIAEVAVTNAASFRYTDDGTDRFTADGNATLRLSADSTYCYRVETVGTYGDPKIRPALLLNFSQVICVTPRDTVRPCPPQLSIDALNCEALLQTACSQTTFSNLLTWTNPTKNSRGDDCDKNLVRYNIYYARYEGDEPKLIATVNAPTQTYTHSNLTSLAGFYYVTAVNRFNTESLRSNVVQKDNCPYYKLPNVMTPNGDGRNDTFQPLDCPLFVETVSFVVYNRWGNKVYESVGDPKLNWRATDNNGKELAAGIYYYEAQVKFARLRREDENQTIKGWIEVLR